MNCQPNYHQHATYKITWFWSLHHRLGENLKQAVASEAVSAPVWPSSFAFLFLIIWSLSFPFLFFLACEFLCSKTLTLIPENYVFLSTVVWAPQQIVFCLCMIPASTFLFSLVFMLLLRGIIACALSLVRRLGTASKLNPWGKRLVQELCTSYFQCSIIPCSPGCNPSCRSRGHRTHCNPKWFLSQLLKSRVLLLSFPFLFGLLCGWLYSCHSHSQCYCLYSETIQCCLDLRESWEESMSEIQRHKKRDIWETLHIFLIILCYES